MALKLDSLKRRMESPLALDSADCYALIAEVERLQGALCDVDMALANVAATWPEVTEVLTVIREDLIPK